VSVAIGIGESGRVREATQMLAWFDVGIMFGGNSLGFVRCGIALAYWP
jgi:hypothetical protein